MDKRVTMLTEWQQFFDDVRFVATIAVLKKDSLAYSQLVLPLNSDIYEVRFTGVEAEQRTDIQEMLSRLTYSEEDSRLLAWIGLEMVFFHDRLLEVLAPLPEAAPPPLDFPQSDPNATEWWVRQAVQETSDDQVSELLDGSKTIKDSIEKIIRRYRKTLNILGIWERLSNALGFINEVLSLLRGGH